MKSVFLVFCLLLLLNSSAHTYKAPSSGRHFREKVLAALEEHKAHLTDLKTEVASLTERVVKLEDYVNMLLDTVVMCESGTISSGRCESNDCFNQRKTVQFNLEFSGTPAVTSALYRIDGGYSSTNITATPEFSPTEISVDFQCLGCGKCGEAIVSWMACGPIVMPYRSAVQR